MQLVLMDQILYSVRLLQPAVEEADIEPFLQARLMLETTAGLVAVLVMALMADLEILHLFFHLKAVMVVIILLGLVLMVVAAVAVHQRLGPT